ncbi:MAG: ACP S-malonyltransferase [Deltaproteobacteria bacterium]|nr:ACP S-malonyltransferase [Deltaproteobacteria bacterium]MBN2671314.1 ACP S-malonyltransferase [Deltaproteobacteria bacterium]
MKTAFVFPGQGAQKVGMGKELSEQFDIAKSTFEEADQALNENFQQLIFEGPAEELTLTANTQPAIVTVSIAALRSFQEVCNVKPDFVAGHSLGEFAALVASGALEFTDAVRTTRARGTYMQEAVPAGKGAMAAVMKVDDEVIISACEAAAQSAVVAPANFNCPEQTVISGEKDAVARASEILKEHGARVIPLKVSAPFHCALMAPAADKLNTFLNDVQFGKPVPPVVTNVEAFPNMDAERIRELLVKQVTSPVLWTDSVRYMIGQGVSTFIEFGPGNVLAGLISKIDSSVEVISVNTPDGIDKAKEVLEKNQS